MNIMDYCLNNFDFLKKKSKIHLTKYSHYFFTSHLRILHKFKKAINILNLNKINRKIFYPF